ncbi:hypothetical protein HHK36_023854 [Tetracentron sinense]|uniref:Senescence regulator n=1 Tax=Tetracentron sinense TaxID=13715 RepID=A0A835D5K8_TETSI|nr:hypothetical protein HHK36_023854 [Tetracentron sinense]
MAETYGFLNMRSNGGRSMRNEEFDEEGVWAVVKERKESIPTPRKSKNSSSVSSPRCFPTASRMIPRAKSSGLEAKIVQQSAPLNIPDWSKIYRKISNKDSDSHGFEDGYDDGTVIHDNDDDIMVPPHEWIAKKLARSQIFSFSLCEGVGRTLKGRDLSKVRDAVLTRTGFLE